MKIEKRSLADIHPYDRNPRANDGGVEAVVRSITEFGFRQPIVVDEDGVIIVGHTRFKAAERLGLEEVPVHVADLSPEQARAYRIADNQTATLSTWQEDLLVEELTELRSGDFDLDLLGFSADELDRLLTPIAVDFDDDEPIPEPPKDPVTRRGDLYVLGGHRLLCGDCTDEANVRRLWGDRGLCDAVVTDPPYGVEYVGKTADALTVANDGAAGLPALLQAAFDQALERSRNGAVWYVAAPAGPQFHAFATVLLGLGVWRQTLVWAKDTMVLGRSDYHYEHEAMFYGWKPGAAHREPPDRKQTTVWRIDRPKASREHPTMKPVALFAKAIANSTAARDLVYDPFLGSGTTLVASEQLRRRCVGMEIDPAYCDVIAQRWERATGKKAERIQLAAAS